MKNRILTIIAGVSFTALGLVSCSEDFTTDTNYGALSGEQLQNETGLNLMLVGAYSSLDGIRDSGGADWEQTGDNWWFDAISDDAHKGSDNADQANLYDLTNFNWTTGNSYIGNKWRALYAGVNRANAVIDLINKIEGGVEAYSNEMAQARFLRGHFYFELTKIYGYVPYIDENNFAASEYTQPNETMVWPQIEADFMFASDNLPTSQGDAGRPTSWVAKAFLAKAYLYQSKWSDASNLFDEVIDSNTYALLDEFGDNFRLAGENGTESVFAIQFTADGGQSFNGNRGATLNAPNGGPGSCCGFYQPTQDLTNTFQTDASGLPLLDTYNQTDITSDYGVESSEAFSPYTGTVDPRLDFTVGRRGIDFNGFGAHVGKDWIRGTFADTPGPYLNKKGFYWNGEDSNVGSGAWGEQRSGMNYHIMRYADVLLMAAEAHAEQGNLSDAVAYVDEVRERAMNSSYLQAVDGSGDAANYMISTYGSFASQDEAIKAIRMERRLELGMESHRLFDLRRWGTGVEVMNEFFVNEARTILSYDGVPNAYQAKHDLLPIPINAIDLSGGVLKQNSGF